MPPMYPALSPPAAAEARHHTYALLARLAADGVTPELLPYVRALPDLNATLPDDPDPETAAAAHQTLFGFEVLPYATVFLDPAGLLGGPVSERLAAAYSADAFAVAEPPDQLAHALAYLAHLAGAEAEATGATAVTLNARQQHILGAYLAPWLLPLSVAVSRQGSPFYTALLDLVVALLDDQLTAVAPALELPQPPALLDDDKTRLRDIATYLARPAHSGFWLAQADLARLGRAVQVPRGFGDRTQLLTNLFRTAAQYEATPALIDGLRQTAVAFADSYAAHATAYPHLAPIAHTWRTRALTTAALLTGLAAHLPTGPTP